MIKKNKADKIKNNLSRRERRRRRALDEMLRDPPRDSYGDAYIGHEFHAESSSGNVGGYGTGGAGYGGGFTQGDDNYGSDYGSRFGATGNRGRDHSGSLERGGAYGADETGGGGYGGSGRSYGSGVGRDADFGYAPRSAGQYYTFGHDHDPRNLHQGGSGLDLPPSPPVTPPP